MTAPTMLLILDGFGHSETLEGNGVAQANKPNFDRLWQQYCHGYLSASGLRSGFTPGANRQFRSWTYEYGGRPCGLSGSHPHYQRH